MGGFLITQADAHERSSWASAIMEKGLSHEKTCDILDDMSQKGFIDSDISKTIRECFGRI